MPYLSLKDLNQNILEFACRGARDGPKGDNATLRPRLWVGLTLTDLKTLKVEQTKKASNNDQPRSSPPPSAPLTPPDQGDRPGGPVRSCARRRMRRSPWQGGARSRSSSCPGPRPP